VPSPGTRDEVGRLLTSLQRMSLYLRETAVMADRIGGTDPAPCGAQGVPGNAFSKIAEAEARHRHLLASVQAIVWRADVASLRFLFVSPGAEKILGHPSRLWIEDPSFWTSHLHPRDRERAQLAHLRAAERGEDQEVEYRMLAADGRTVWLQGSVRRVVSGDAGPELVGVLVDVTEHKRAKQALEQSERQLAEAQRLAHVGSWEWDVVANRLTWSEELCRIFGREGRAPARYEGSLRLVHPEDRTAVEAAVQAALDQGRAFALDHRIVRPDGSVRTIHSLGRVDLDESGKPSRLVGAAQDVTEARAAAVARIESEARYRRLLANIPDVAWTSASDGTTAFISAKVEAL
jgi:PAS domain S-box-containing protein